MEKRVLEKCAALKRVRESQESTIAEFQTQLAEADNTRFQSLLRVLKVFSPETRTREVLDVRASAFGIRTRTPIRGCSDGAGASQAGAGHREARAHLRETRATGCGRAGRWRSDDAGAPFGTG